MPGSGGGDDRDRLKSKFAAGRAIRNPLARRRRFGSETTGGLGGMTNAGGVQGDFRRAPVFL